MQEEKGSAAPQGSGGKPQFEDGEEEGKCSDDDPPPHPISFK